MKISPLPFQQPIWQKPARVKTRVDVGSMPKFQGKLSMVQKLLNKFDFLEVGKTALRHSQLLYVCLILARDIAAIKRGSMNEVREHTLRDILGASSWFYLTPMMYPVFLQLAIGKQYREALVNNTPPVEGKGLWATLRHWNQTWNPLFRWEIPTAEQLEERMKHSLTHLEKTMGGKKTTAYHEAETFFKDIIKRRRYASGLGVAFTVLFLGIGIPLINIFTTRRKVLEGDAMKHHQQLIAPQNPFLVQPPVVSSRQIVNMPTYPPFMLSPGGLSPTSPIRPLRDRLV